MTNLEIILTVGIWIIYGVFNASQHDFHKNTQSPEPSTFFNIIVSPIALVIRIIRGVFFWKGNY